uniref:Nose resistant-to-fluoxetine protein N-terminal domain-containing protein n=1 Tax=Panagrolaimus superbus TaxID=310955 RepID=A0A914YQK4_9BILA
MILLQNPRKEFIFTFVGLFLVCFGLLWRFHASQKGFTNINGTNLTLDEPLIGNPFGKIPAAKDVAQEIKANFQTLRNDKNLGHLWQGLMELRIGNASLKSMKDGLLSATGSLSQKCGYDMLRAIENMAATGFYATSCHLDHLTNKNKSSSKCFESETSSLLWASHLFDSWGKPPSGVASSGPFFLMGDFEQCLNISIPPLPNSKNSSTGLVIEKTQYCRADFHFGERSSAILTYGICAPESCTALDMQYFINFWTNDLLKHGLGIDFQPDTDISCFIKDENIQWTIPEIIFLSIIAGVVGIILLGTVIDYFSHHRPTLKSHSPLIHHRKRQHAGYESVVDENEIDDVVSTASKESFIPVEMYFKDFITKDVRMEAGRSNYKADFMSIMEDELSIAGAPSVALTYKGGEEMKQTFTHTHFLIDIIAAFSIRRSVEHLLRESGSQIRCLHGMKVISAVWVIIGHSFLLAIGYIGNPKHLVEQIQSMTFAQWLFNSSLSVDSFFLMSGAVLAFSFRKRLISAKNDETRLYRLFAISRWLVVYFHRWLRLLPTYAVVLGCTATIYNRLGSGPMWQNDGVFGSKCNANDWWHHLLFILNFFPTECMPWMWYLSLDTQFYLISPLLLFLLHKLPSFGKSVVGILVLGCGIYRAVIYKIYDFPSNIILRMLEKETIISDEAAKMFGLLYAAPQARIAPFVIGILLGWILAVKKRATHFQSRRKDCQTSWLGILSMKILSILFIVWAMHGPDFGFFGSKWFEIFYSSQHRIFWSIGLALMVWLCERGHFEPLGTILGWDKWVPISRLCFGIYLSHELIIILFVYQRRRVWMIENPLEIITFALGVTVLSTLCAAFLAIFVELPPLTLERKLFMRIRKNVALRRNDDGNLTVSECGKSMRSILKGKRRNYAESSSTQNDFDDESNTMAALPNLLPTAVSEHKVMDWLEQTEDEATRQEQTERNSPTTLGTENSVMAAEPDLLKVYPWDNSQWGSDSRVNQTVPTASSTSPNTDSVTQVVDAQDCVKTENSQVARIVKQVKSDPKFYQSTDA